MAAVTRRAVDHVDVVDECGEQAGHILRRVLQVVIQGDDQLVVGRPDAAEQRVVLADVARQHQGTDAGVPLGEACQHGPTAVATAVVDEDDVEDPDRGFQHRHQPVHQFGQCGRTVVDRHDDAQGALICRQQDGGSVTDGRRPLLTAPSRNPHIHVKTAAGRLGDASWR